MFRNILRSVRSSIGRSSSPEPGTADLITRVRARRLTYLSERKLASLAETCSGIEKTGVPGAVLEAGCALGGSTIVIASLKAPARPFRVYDVFAMIPPPTADDPPEVHERYQTIVSGQSKGIGGDRYYGYEDDLLSIVHAHLREFGITPEGNSVTLVKGLVQDTLVVEDPVAFAHVDVDWYDPVMTCLTRIFPKLSVGGSMILDDYEAWGGCRKAADEYLATVPGQFIADTSSSALKITRART